MTPVGVGLDLSLSSTGIALADGTVTMVKTEPLRGMERIERVRSAVANALEPMNGRGKTECLVAVEGYAPTHIGTAIGAGELGGVIRHMLWRQAIPFAVVTPGSLKLYATGHGNASKTGMVIAARERLGYEGQWHDEADALWLRCVALDLLGAPPAVVPKAHRRALSAIQFPEGGALR